MLKTFKDLRVWQKSYALTLDVYRNTASFPSEELYGLTSQIRRAAASIPSNIAEGYWRGHTSEYIRFVSIAYGSLAEVLTQLMLSRDLGYMDETSYNSVSSQYEDLERMLAALIRSLKSK